MFLKTSSSSSVLMVAMSLLLLLSVRIASTRLRLRLRRALRAAGRRFLVGPRRGRQLGGLAAALDSLIDERLDAVGEVAGERLEQAGRLGQRRLEAAGEHGQQLLARRDVGEGVDVGGGQQPGTEQAALDDELGFVRPKSRSALAAVTASPPSATKRSRPGPRAAARMSVEPGLVRRPAGERVLEHLVLGRRRAQRRRAARRASATVRPRYSVSTAASASPSRCLISSMTAVLRWSCALSASALVGMWFTSSGGRCHHCVIGAHYLVRRPEVIGIRLSACNVAGGR